MSLNWIRTIEERIKWLFGGMTQSRTEAQRDLARLTALNESVKKALQETAEKGSSDSVHHIRPVEIEAELAKLKIDMSRGFDRGTGLGGGSDPFSPARVPRRPLPTNGSGEVALPLPEPEAENDT